MERTWESKEESRTERWKRLCPNNTEYLDSAIPEVHNLHFSLCEPINSSPVCLSVCLFEPV